MTTVQPLAKPPARPDYYLTIFHATPVERVRMIKRGLSAMPAVEMSVFYPSDKSSRAGTLDNQQRKPPDCPHAG